MVLCAKQTSGGKVGNYNTEVEKNLKLQINHLENTINNLMNKITS